jgi:L-threonylcarbamoyladenylate synthase
VIEKIDRVNPDSHLLEKAARLIEKGKVLVCPTDTGYAFSANGLDVQAIARVFKLKGRSYSNPMHVAVSSIEDAEKYAHVGAVAKRLAIHFLPGALTLVLPRKETVSSLLVGGRDTIGIRIPDNRVILDLASMTGLPLTTTSANISGKPTPYSVEEILEQFGESIRQVALVLDQGVISTRELSTIVDLTVSPPQLIRQGRVSWLEIREFLKNPDSSN